MAKDGKCGVHHYANITQEKIHAILEALKNDGAVISGSNPWTVDTHKHGVKLQGTWDDSGATLTVIVTNKNFVVPCSKIWETIDPLINHIAGLKKGELA